MSSAVKPSPQRERCFSGRLMNGHSGMTRSRSFSNICRREAGYKSISNSRNVDQLVSLVISDDDGVETVSAREVSADYQFLSAIHLQNPVALWIWQV